MSAQTLVTKVRGAGQRDAGRFLSRTDTLTASEAELIRRARDTFRQGALHAPLTIAPGGADDEGSDSGRSEPTVSGGSAREPVPHVSRFVPAPGGRLTPPPVGHDDQPTVLADDGDDELLDWLVDHSTFL